MTRGRLSALGCGSTSSAPASTSGCSGIWRTRWPAGRSSGMADSLASPTRKLTPALWASAAHIFQQILPHPFLARLVDGTLPEERFQVYVMQDALYLREYARCLALASAKAPNTFWCEMFAAHAQSALNVERSLHEGYFADWGLDPAQIEASPPTPTTLAYTSYLLRTAYSAPFEE